MGNDLTLEKEFEIAKLRTMRSVVNAVTMKAYMDKQLQGVTIPTFLVDKKELQYKASIIADNIVDKIMENGELEQAFEESWKAIAEFLP